VASTYPYREEDRAQAKRAVPPSASTARPLPPARRDGVSLQQDPPRNPGGDPKVQDTFVKDNPYRFPAFRFQEGPPGAFDAAAHQIRAFDPQRDPFPQPAEPAKRACSNGSFPQDSESLPILPIEAEPFDPEFDEPKPFPFPACHNVSQEHLSEPFAEIPIARKGEKSIFPAERSIPK
jgi:hypothetical protein